MEVGRISKDTSASRTALFAEAVKLLRMITSFIIHYLRWQIHDNFGELSELLVLRARKAHTLEALASFEDYPFMSALVTMRQLRMIDPA